MNDDERMRAAPADRVAALLGSDVPAGVADRLADMARFAPRLRAAAARRLGSLPPLDRRQAAALALDADGLRAVALKAGAVWHAPALSRIVDGAARGGVVEALGPDVYRLALEGRALAPNGGTADLPGEDGLAEATAGEGQGCWAAWRAAQPGPVAARLSLLDSGVSPQVAHRNFGPAIVDWLLDRA